MKWFTRFSCKTEEKEKHPQAPEASRRPAIVVVIRQRGPSAQNTYVELDVTRALIRRGWHVSRLSPSQQDELYAHNLDPLGRNSALLVGSVWKTGYYEFDDPHSSNIQERTTEVHIDARIVGEGGTMFRTRHIVVKGRSLTDFEKLSKGIADFVEETLGKESCLTETLSLEAKNIG